MSEIGDLFRKTFDVPTLCMEICSMIKNPAQTRKKYHVVCTKTERVGMQSVTFEFKTNENTFITRKFNIDSVWEALDDFLASMGVSFATMDTVLGKEYDVYYENEWTILFI